jgi:hypothetical protein
VLELFLKPAVERPGYYEFQVNAANTHFDLYLPEGNRPNGGTELVKKDVFTWKTNVVRRGTLDRRDDRDEGWSVEGKIPWLDLKHTGSRPEPGDIWRLAVCRYNYGRSPSEPEVTSNAPFTVDFHQTEKYVPVRFLGPRPNATDNE